MQLNITKIVLVRRSHGMDQIILETDILEPCFPGNGNFSVLGWLPRGCGEEFVREKFGLEVKVMGETNA